MVEAFREEQVFIDAGTGIRDDTGVSPKRVPKLGHADFIIYYIYAGVYVRACNSENSRPVSSKSMGG